MNNNSKDIKQFVDKYFRVYFTERNFDKIKTLFSSEITVVGTGLHEFGNTPEETLLLYKKDLNEVSTPIKYSHQNFKITFVSTYISTVTGTLIIQGNVDGQLFSVPDLRYTMTLKKEEGCWKILQSHISTPNDQQEKDELYPLQKISELNKLLNKTVDERTRELEISNEKIKKSEKKYRLITENISDVVWVLNISKNKFTYISPSDYKITGYTAKEAIKQSIRDKFSPESAKLAEETIQIEVQKFIKNPEDSDIRLYNLQQKCKNGNLVWIEISVRFRYNSDNEIELLGTTRNVDDHKKAEDDLQKSEEKYRGLIENLIDGFYKTDADGNAIFINPSAINILGISKEEIIGKPVASFYANPDERKDFLKKIKKTGKIENYPTEFIRKGKSNIFLEANAQVIYKDGKYNGVDGVFRDVTERKKQELTKEIIYNITKRANQNPSLEALFPFIKLELGKLINTSNFFIALYDEVTKMVSRPYMVDEIDNNNDFPKEKTLTGYVIDTKKSLLANQAIWKKIQRAEKLKYFGAVAKCWLGVPLLIDNKAIGAIVIQSYTDKNAYTEKDVSLLELIASNISQVIKQSQDFEKINLLNKALIQSSESVIITNLEGEIEYVNPAFTKLSGYSAKEALGNTPRILKSGEQDPKIYDELWQTITNGASWRGELINKRKDNKAYLVIANISPVKNIEGNITHFIGIQEDITKKRQLERNFIHAFIDAQEQEKQSFGEDLHDGISQILTAESMFIQAFIVKNKDTLDTKSLEHLERIRKFNYDAMIDARNLAHGLMSKQLKEDGLLKAIEHICLDYSHSRDIKFDFTYKGLVESDFHKEIKTNIFRIIQEVSTNTIRHSLAKKATIKLSKVGKDSLKLIIKDDGVGIDFEKMKKEHKGAGIKNIEQRVTLLNGKMNLESEPDKGTCYTITTPLAWIK